MLVATPGRLLDLIDQRALTLRNVEIFVLDEADQMMDLGFIVPLKRVAAMLPKERQSLFFSATMPKAIADLGRQFINNPVRVEVTPQATTAERVEQFVTFVNQAEKQALLTLRLRDGLADGSIDRALVFTRTKHGADRVVRHLVTAKVNAAAIHGNKSQGQRTAALAAFRKGDCPVLVATDIAARGIDVTGVSHVFNFEMPNVPEQYVHRIGRTARAGADGIAMSFVAPDEKAYLRDIERLTGIKLMPLPLPDDFQKEAARLPAPSRNPTKPRKTRTARNATRAGAPAAAGRAAANKQPQQWRTRPRRQVARRSCPRRLAAIAQADRPQGERASERPHAERAQGACRAIRSPSAITANGVPADRSGSRTGAAAPHAAIAVPVRTNAAATGRPAPTGDRRPAADGDRRHFRGKGPGQGQGGARGAGGGQRQR